MTKAQPGEKLLSDDYEDNAAEQPSSEQYISHHIHQSDVVQVFWESALKIESSVF